MLRITKSQIRDLIREVEFQEKRVRRAIDLFGERPGWLSTRERMLLLREILLAIKNKKRIEVVDDDSEEVRSNVSVHHSSKK